MREGEVFSQMKAPNGLETPLEPAYMVEVDLAAFPEAYRPAIKMVNKLDSAHGRITTLNRMAAMVAECGQDPAPFLNQAVELLRTEPNKQSPAWTASLGEVSELILQLRGVGAIQPVVELLESRGVTPESGEEGYFRIACELAQAGDVAGARRILDAISEIPNRNKTSAQVGSYRARMARAFVLASHPEEAALLRRGLTLEDLGRSHMDRSYEPTGQLEGFKAERQHLRELAAQSGHPRFGPLLALESIMTESLIETFSSRRARILQKEHGATRFEQLIDVASDPRCPADLRISTVSVLAIEVQHSLTLLSNRADIVIQTQSLLEHEMSGPAGNDGLDPQAGQAVLDHLTQRLERWAFPNGHASEVATENLEPIQEL